MTFKEKLALRSTYIYPFLFIRPNEIFIDIFGSQVNDTGWCENSVLLIVTVIAEVYFNTKDEQLESSAAAW